MEPGQVGRRGYFGIGVEGASKPMNFGNLARSAHGFGASFVFTVAATRVIGHPGSDTSHSSQHVPWYSFDSAQQMTLPDQCRLVGVELIDQAIDLPAFRHPLKAAYVLGPEGGSLSPAMLARCEFVVRIPIPLCINLATAGAVVMYDRMISLGRFAERPVRAGAALASRSRHLHGKPVYSGGRRIVPTRADD